VISEPSPGYSPINGLLRYTLLKAFPTSSEDDQIRFEEEIAGISAERDAIEKARLTLLEDHQKLKAETVHLFLTAADSRNGCKSLSRQQKRGPEMPRTQHDH